MMVLSCATLQLSISTGVRNGSTLRRYSSSDAGWSASETKIQPADDLDMGGLQANAGRIEVLAHVPRPDQAAVEVVAPLVIGADEAAGAARSLLGKRARPGAGRHCAGPRPGAGDRAG